MDKKSWVLSKKYTDETAAQFGGLKGANCKITNIVHENGQNVVTFEWKNDEGETRESYMYVDDGTPILPYTVGETYKYGDLVIYESAFYRCAVEQYVAGPVLDKTSFEEIGSPDGNYDIVQNSAQLPPRFTLADRKLFYAIEEETFFLWNGEKWEKQFIVDDKLDDNSKYPLENRIITAEFKKKQDKLTAGDGITIKKDEETDELTISGNSIEQNELREMWKDPGALILGRDTVSVSVGDFETSSIIQHTGDVSAISLDDTTATVEVSSNAIVITGVSIGETTIEVTSASTAVYRKETKEISVTVN